MTDITNAEAVKFSNQDIRPICEILQDVKGMLQIMLLSWYGGVSGFFPNDSSLLDDGREAEGATRLTGADITNVMAMVENVVGEIDDNVVNKPCVRSPVRR